MKRIKKLVALISAAVLLAVLLLGANTIFTVTEIEIAFAVSSEQAYEDSLTLQKTLEGQYLGENILFVSEKEAVACFDGYTFLSVESFSKSYPSSLRISVTEKEEVYAFAESDGEDTIYHMCSGSGEILRVSDANENNVDGGPNLLVEGLEYSESAGFADDGNYEAALAACVQLDGLADGIRTCFLSLEVSSTVTATEFLISTHEGVSIEIDSPSVSLSEKIDLAFGMYQSLEDGEKLYGTIIVVDDSSGTGIIGTYRPRA